VLAYVFFHRPAPGVEAGGYESLLRRFHAALEGAGPEGFIGSKTYRVGDGYADWYLVETSAALDPLNEAAVTGARSASHQSVAHMSTDGAGKLLARIAGVPPAGPGFETRFAKPAGMGYPELYERLKPWTDRTEVSLWRRMMVLGPPPEFCLLSPSVLELPAEMKPETLRREPV
jgi:hypothetical protein